MRISDLSSCVCSSDLYSTGYLSGEFHVPHLVAFACYIAIALGTLSGGWKIIETMGGRITKLSHHQGFAASTGGSIMVFAASLLGIPVSTPHTITGSIIGAGVARRPSEESGRATGRAGVGQSVKDSGGALPITKKKTSTNGNPKEK